MLICAKAHFRHVTLVLSGCPSVATVGIQSSSWPIPDQLKNLVRFSSERCCATLGSELPGTFIKYIHSDWFRKRAGEETVQSSFYYMKFRFEKILGFFLHQSVLPSMVS